MAVVRFPPDLLPVRVTRDGYASDHSTVYLTRADDFPVMNGIVKLLAATYEPTLTQALKASNKPGAHILVSSRDYPGLITDVIVARTDDLKANPEQYRKFLRGIYRAIDYFKTNRAEAIKIMAPHFKLSPEEYEELLVNLEYTPYEEAVEYLGTSGQRGKLHDLFDTVMLLNIENGAADVKLDSNQQIDNSIITELFKDHKR